jgi:hypothetical protein
MSEKEDSHETIPYQMDVYFSEFPQIDAARLEKFINDSDPGEDPCTIEKSPDPDGGEIQLGGYLASLGEFSMMMLLHGVPSPAADIITHSPLPEPVKNTMEKHKAFALLTNFGGEGYRPYENQIFLLKVAMGLCDQGAMGASFVHLGACFPSDLLLGLHGAARDADGHTLWKSIREDAEPMQLLANIAGLECGGRRFLVTRGFAFCGFSDFIYEPSPGEDMTEVTAFFQNAFTYLMANGPVIQAGHTMGYDENVAFRFSEPPSDLSLPFETYSRLLMVTREETPKKKKKLFGLF